MSDVIRHVTIGGRVQGVGYRYWVEQQARALGLQGWVRNRRDGTVEALLQGTGPAVEAVIAWARRGPPGARVESLADSAAEPNAAHARFELHPTA